jgi:hypothetical protein
MDNELCKCGKIENNSCPNDERCGSVNTQLPAEVVNDICAKADAYIKSYEDEGTEYGAYVAGAAEYATKFHQAQQEIAQLKQWQIEAIAVLDPILDYGRSKEAGIPLGKSITNTVLERCKQIDAARALLEKVINRREGGLLRDRLLYKEIKIFLNGTK